MVFVVIWAILATFTTLALVLTVFKRGALFGNIVVIESEEGMRFLLELEGDPAELVQYDHH